MKQRILIICFSILAMVIVFTAWGLRDAEYISLKVVAQKVKTTEIQKFYEVEGFYENRVKENRLYYQASQLKIYDQKVFLFELPKGQFYTVKLGLTDYKAKKGRFDRVKEILKFEQDVEFYNQDFDLTCQKADYSVNEDIFNGYVDVDSRVSDPESKDIIKAKSQTIKIMNEKKFVRYTEDVDGKIIRPRVYDDVTIFKAQVVDVDFINRMAELTDKVYVENQDFKIRSRKGELFLDNYYNDLKYYVFRENVEVDQRYIDQSGQWDTRKAFSELLEGYPEEEKVILSGTPKVIQKQEIIRGNYITLRQNVGLIEVEDSAASVIYQEGNKANQDHSDGKQL